MIQGIMAAGHYSAPWTMFVTQEKNERNMGGEKTQVGE